MMKELNNYIYNVFNLIRQTQQSGFLQRPLTYHITKTDKKILNNIYNVYKIYKYGLTKSDFRLIVKDYSLNSGFNIIKAGSEMGQLLEKINTK